jgi:hypothetical protein
MRNGTKFLAGCRRRSDLTGLRRDFHLARDFSTASGGKSLFMKARWKKVECDVLFDSEGWSRGVVIPSADDPGAGRIVIGPVGTVRGVLGEKYALTAKNLVNIRRNAERELRKAGYID